MVTLDELSRNERSLLLYFESVSVDYSGLVDLRRMNSDDIKIAEKWNEIGFIKFGRIAYKFLPVGASKATHWCNLSEYAWKLAHSERLARFERNYSQRNWMTTEEYRNS